MVYTVTLNPALDYVVSTDSLRSGEMNRASSEQIQFGGKGINVSAMLRTLGVDSVALGFTAGFTGKELERRLRGCGIRTDFIWLKTGQTRINVKVKAKGESGEIEETEINASGPDIPMQALEALLQKLGSLASGDVLVLAGSIPGTLPGDVYQRILQRIDGRGVLTVVDAEGSLLLNALAYRPFLVKPNHIELGALFGRTLEKDEEIVACAHELQSRGARNVLVSMAGDGSLLLDETGMHRRLPGLKGDVRNSVGAGDSMVAGFLAGWLDSGDYEVAHMLGTAAATATAFSNGLATRGEIREIIWNSRSYFRALL